MVKKSKTSLVNEFKLWLIAEFGEVKGYYERVYLTPRDTAVPEDDIGDDVTEDIRCMYSRPLNFISDRLMKQKKTVGFAVPMVDASWEDSTGYALMYKDRVLYKNYTKAWHFYFESEKDFEEFLQGIWDDCIKALEQMVDDEDLYYFDFIIRQGQYEHFNRKAVRAKDEKEAYKKAMEYIRDFYGESLTKEKDGEFIYNDGEIIGEFKGISRTNVKNLVELLTIEG